VFWETFLHFQFVFVIFCPKEIGAKAVSKMLVKWETIYLSIANFFATQNIGGAKELVVFFEIVATANINNELKD